MVLRPAPRNCWPCLCCKDHSLVRNIQRMLQASARSVFGGKVKKPLSDFHILTLYNYIYSHIRNVLFLYMFISQTHMYMYMYMYMYICICICICTCICICMCIYIHIHTYIYIYYTYGGCPKYLFPDSPQSLGQSRSNRGTTVSNRGRDCSSLIRSYT